ncbi:MAG: hypothetical protein M3506_01765 [Chloroflexota bacterium]|nr:hypothetical protein [Chloroflexota bacterium]
MALYHFNQLWLDAAARGEILTWIVLFNGVFKVALEMMPPDRPLEHADEQRGGFLSDEPSLLSCPNGRILVASLDRLGQGDLEPLAVIEPGLYRAALSKDYDREPDHWFLENETEYPASDGPAWLIRLQKLQVTTTPCRIHRQRHTRDLR